MNDEETIYDLKLGENMILNKILSVTRVPGGWLMGYSGSEYSTDVFVPFNKEFQTP